MLIPFDQLWRRWKIRSRTVLHLGANEGQEAEAYAKQGIQKVIWVEAIPTVFQKLQQHLRSFPGQIALDACVSDECGQEVTFNVASNEGQSSSMLAFGTHLKAHPNVRYVTSIQLVTTRVDCLLATHRIDIERGSFLNIDLQGAELLALKGMGDLIWRFDYAYIEVNTEHLYVNCPLVEEIDDYLRQYGLEGRETKMTNWGWGDKFYARTK